MHTRCQSLLALCFAFLLLVAADSQAQDRNAQGRVRDASGAAIAGAEVEFRSPELTLTTRTDQQGRFVFQDVPSRGIITIQAPGFAPWQTQWQEGRAPVEATLTPAPRLDELTVTATRVEARLGEVPESVVMLSAEYLDATPALALDDVLRQVPGFTLFRRSSSRVANPTAQGVSLRGVGASGASRALVLRDGVALNDPFGGWVYWSRIPRTSLERVEVLRGGTSHLYGSDALGGVVSALSRSAAQTAASAELSYGNTGTGLASGTASARLGRWGLGVAAEGFRTDGYVLVDEAERGPVDMQADSQHATGEATVERQLLRGRWFLRGSAFGEERDNGTPLQENRTTIRQLATGLDWNSEAIGAIAARLYGSDHIYHQSFSAIAPQRDSESLTRLQRVPAQQVGLAAHWSRLVGLRHTLLAGADARQVRGVTQEQGFFNGDLTSLLEAGGRQRSIGVFVQDAFRIAPRWQLTAGVRVDRWRNFSASSTTQPVMDGVPGEPSRSDFADRSETDFSPRLAVLYRPNALLRLHAGAYRAFRAPTLNELYRGFRVGSIVTLANEDLLAERLTGFEAGAGLLPFDSGVSLRGVFFWSQITRPIANVTLAVEPTLITRQRQNMGRTRSRGVELDLTLPLGERLELSSGYQFAAATVTAFPANPALEGLWIPQTPRHQFTFQARYRANGGTLFALQGRAVGAQFDDDRNLLRLDGYFSLDAMALHPLRQGVDLFVAVENLTGERYPVGRTPVLTVGPPVLARAGLRLRWGRL